MKSVKKALLLVLCAVLVVAASVMGTLAYLTDTEAVTNTFSVGSVGLSLDEAKVTPDGVEVAGADRVHDNEYHLLPGMTYTKDPIIHVDANSEDRYIFVKVDNQIAAYEAASGDGYTDIADQIAANGWTALDGVPNVYYQTYTKGQSDKDFAVFANFKIDGMANTVDGWDAITPETTKVKVTGYAVQQAGFGTAQQAWDAADFPEDAGGSGDNEIFDYTVNLNESGLQCSNVRLWYWCKEHGDDIDMPMSRTDDENWSVSFNNNLSCASEECNLSAGFDGEHEFGTLFVETIALTHTGVYNIAIEIG